MNIVDTNVLVRHLTRDPPDQAERATRRLESEEELFCPDVVLAELLHVLRSRYRRSRTESAAAARSVLGLENLVFTDDSLLVRATDVYEEFRIGFPDAYLVALAEREGIRKIVSFDKDFDKIPGIERVEP